MGGKLKQVIFMRMRNKKHCDERMEKCGRIWSKEPSLIRGDWRKEFGNDNPIHLEIGCGRGKFISDMAKLNPDINYIAAERVTSALVVAMEKAFDKGIKNVRFISVDAQNLDEYFETGEIDRIYLNFSDPWPKKKRAKRRLTHKNFLDIYKKILVSDGAVYFKTDNKALFEFSLNSFSEEDFKLKNITFDLHNSGFEGNIMTEYEEKFSSAGMPIYRLEAYIRNL